MTTTMTTTTVDIPFPPDPNPHRPKLIAPPGSWDTHFHVFGPPDRFPYAENRRYTPPAAPIEHWLKIASAIGIERGFLVTPSVHDLDPAVTLDAIERSEGRVRGMIRANSSMTRDEVRAFHAKGIRGLRFPFAAAVRRAFDVDAFRANIAVIEDMPWVAEFQIDGDALERHAELIAAVQMPVIIDEFGGVRPKGGLDQPAFRILMDLLALPHIHLKMICPDRHLYEGSTYDEVVAMSRATIERAPGRVIWGTDWPHAYVFDPNRMPNDGDLLDMLLDFAPDPTVQKQILVDAPTKLFGGD